MSSVVSLEISGAVAKLQINRPEALNAINNDVIHSLEKYISFLEKSTKIHLVLMSGAGEKAFVAGADIKEMQNLNSQEAAQFSKFGTEVFLRLSALPQIVIAQIQGFALGGGLELAMAADIIVASQKARFGLPETSLGLIPGFGGTQKLARRIGLAQALEWMSTGDKYSAEEALRVGLVNHIWPSEELIPQTEKLISQILKNGPEAIKAAKRIASTGFDLPLREACIFESQQFGLQFGTSEMKEGVKAFLEKRSPQF